MTNADGDRHGARQAAGEAPGTAVPEPVATAARPLLGAIDRITVLGGMGGARVVQLAGPGGTLVAKGGVSGRERAVYERLVASLAERGVRIPRWHATVLDGDDVWLLIEDIPVPLPPDRWLADASVMATLRRLHALPTAALDVLPSRFRPAWTASMEAAALAWLGDGTLGHGRLAALREEAAPLFEPTTVISGDPNPLNWGLSATGELVLLDWERIGLGHPALDVAITVPGLGTLPAFQRAVASYRSDGGPEVSARQLVLAKLWSVVELLAPTPTRSDENGRDGPRQRRSETASQVAALLPSWLDEVT